MKKEYVDLDPFTFGDSRASQNLASILNGIGDVKLAASIAKTINYYSKSAKVLNEISDLSMRTRFLGMLRREVERSTIINRAPELVKSHTFNVVKGRISEYMRKTQHKLNKEKSDAAKLRNKNGN